MNFLLLLTNKYILSALGILAVILTCVGYINHVKSVSYSLGKTETEKIWNDKYNTSVAKIIKENNDRAIEDKKIKEAIEKRNADLDKKNQKMLVDLAALKAKKPNLSNPICAFDKETLDFINED